MKKLFLLFLAFYCFGLLAQNAQRANMRAKDFLKSEDPESALPFLIQAAELGLSEAMFNLAYLYQKGLAVEQSDSIAHYWYLKAARNGAVNAQFKVAYNYASGRGTQVAPEKTFYWTLKCAKQKDPECISNLVACYADGFGVEANADSAFAWTVRAACLPDIENLHLSGMITWARLSLAQNFGDPENPGYDVLQSYKWYLIYNESKRDLSLAEQQEHMEVIHGLEGQLSEQVKHQVKSMAEIQIGRPLKNYKRLHKIDH